MFMRGNAITRLLFVRILSIFLCVFAGMSCAEESRLEVQSTVDLGVVSSTEAEHPLEIAYSVKGGKSFRVMDIVPNCTCITMDVPREELPSYSSGKFKGTINLKGFHPQTLHKEVRIYTLNSKTPITVKITGTVVRD